MYECCGNKRIPFRSAEMLHSWMPWDAESEFDVLLSNARQALSLFQHHDGITGTAKDHVVLDYAKQMNDALKSCKFVIQQSVYRYLTKSSVSIYNRSKTQECTYSAFLLRSTNRTINIPISTLTIHEQLIKMTIATPLFWAKKSQSNMWCCTIRCHIFAKRLLNFWFRSHS